MCFSWWLTFWWGPFSADATFCYPEVVTRSLDSLFQFFTVNCLENCLKLQYGFCVVRRRLCSWRPLARFFLFIANLFAARRINAWVGDGMSQFLRDTLPFCKTNPRNYYFGIPSEYFSRNLFLAFVYIAFFPFLFWWFFWEPYLLCWIFSIIMTCFLIVELVFRLIVFPGICFVILKSVPGE